MRRLLKNLSLVSFILLALLLVEIACFIWALNRGFDFTDEAFSYLGFRGSDEIANSATYYTVILNNLIGWIPLSIIKLRILRIAATVICGSFFSYSLMKWSQKEYGLQITDQINLFLFILIGSLLVNATGSQSFSYNLTSVLILQLISGCVLSYLLSSDTSKKQSAFLLLGTGALLFALFAIKFSNTVLLLPLLILLMFTKPCFFLNRVYQCLLLLSGFFLGGFFFFKTSLFTWLVNYVDTLTAIGKNTGASIWMRYIEDLQFTFTSKLVSNLAYIIVILCLLFAYNYLKNKATRYVIALITSVVIAYLAYLRDYYLGGIPYYYTYTGLYIILIFLLIISQCIFIIDDHLRKKDWSLKPLFSIAIILAIPFIGSVGTNNLISIQIIWYAGFLFAAIYLLLLRSKGIMSGLIIILISANAISQSLSGLIYFPYRINGTLYDQSQHISKLITNEQIMVNVSLNESIEKTHSIIQAQTTFKTGDPLFSFSPDYFGFIYLMNGNLPGWSWYDEKGNEANRLALLNTDPIKWQRTIIFVPPNFRIDSLYQSSFRKLNINFPDDYSNLGSVPYLMGETDRTLTIYAPKGILK